MKIWIALGILTLVSLPAAWAAGGEVVPFDSPRWTIDAKEARVVDYLGRHALYLKAGGAWLADVDFQDGTIEFDIAVPKQRGFSGLFWRMQDEEDFEHFYVRPHQSGQPDANQYTPVFHGIAGWQLYYGERFATPVEYRYDQWMHVRVVVSGTQAEVYIGSEEPVLFIPELKHGLKAGKIGVNASRFAPAYFSNFRYQLATAPRLIGTPPKPETMPAGIVKTWQISTVFAGKRLEGKTALTDEDKQGLKWTPLAVEERGYANLARVQGIDREKGKNTAFARLSLRSDREQVVKVRFGFSDAVKVYLNERLLYGGDDAYQSRDYRFLGTIGLFDELYLPLHRGVNELWFAVSENFGGWGIMASVEERPGLEVE